MGMGIYMQRVLISMNFQWAWVTGSRPKPKDEPPTTPPSKQPNTDRQTDASRVTTRSRLRSALQRSGPSTLPPLWSHWRQRWRANHSARARMRAYAKWWHSDLDLPHFSAPRCRCRYRGCHYRHTPTSTIFSFSRAIHHHTSSPA